MPIPRGPSKPPATGGNNGNAEGTGEGDNQDTPRVVRPAVKYSGPIKWQKLSVRSRRHVIAIIRGPDQSGKSHWALTAPDPIAVLTFDPANFDGVANNLGADSRDIQMISFEMPKGLVATRELAQIAAQETARLQAYFLDAVNGSYFRTVVLDREDEVWELHRYEEFDGKSSAKSHHYTQLNMAYKAMLKMAEKNNKNLIMIDAMSAEYKANQPTGRMKRDGFKHLGMLSQLELEAIVDDYGNFSIQVVKCRDNATRNGVIMKPEVISEVVAANGGSWPEDPNSETGYGYFPLTFENVMSYLTGGAPDDWR